LHRRFPRNATSQPCHYSSGKPAFQQQVIRGFFAAGLPVLPGTKAIEPPSRQDRQGKSKITKVWTLSDVSRVGFSKLSAFHSDFLAILAAWR
jgi:hypothetical protein